MLTVRHSNSHWGKHNWILRILPEISITSDWIEGFPVVYYIKFAWLCWWIEFGIDGDEKRDR